VTLLVLGSALDDHPAALGRQWRCWGRDAVLVQPRDLSGPGWRLRVGRAEDLAAAASGRRFRHNDIEGVVCALPWIAPYELVHVVEADRDYVAQEMGSFLLAWLNEFKGPVVDHATPLNLAGCGRSRWQWAAVARSAGIAADPGWSGPTVSVTVVGGEHVSAHAREPWPDGLEEAARAIARASARTLVTLTFATSEDVVLVGAEPRPAVGEAGVARDLLNLMERM
jgi:hypothetical protein